MYLDICKAILFAFLVLLACDQPIANGFPDLKHSNNFQESDILEYYNSLNNTQRSDAFLQLIKQNAELTAKLSIHHKLDLSKEHHSELDSSQENIAITSNISDEELSKINNIESSESESSFPNDSKRAAKKRIKHESTAKDLISKDSIIIDASYVEKIGGELSSKLSTELQRINSAPMIDVVITWVNSSETTFLEEFHRVSHRKCGKLCDKKSLMNGRYMPSNEIYLNLMSLCYQNTWVRTIFIVSNQVLDLSYFLPMCRNRIAFVTHKEIMPAEYLPIYNSNVIESYIHKIPNLSEIFVYLNDDIMFTQSFDLLKLIKKKLPILVPSSKLGFICDPKLNNPRIKISSAPHLHVYYNTHAIFSDRFKPSKCYPWSFRGHAPYFQIKSLHELSWNLFQKYLRNLHNNRFRYEVHYKLGGDFSLLYLSNYIGKYLGIIEFTDTIFKSYYPRKDDDYLKVWNDPNANSIVMHDRYNAMSWQVRLKICSTIITKACSQIPPGNGNIGRCISGGMELCNKEHIDYDSNNITIASENQV